MKRADEQCEERQGNRETRGREIQIESGRVALWWQKFENTITAEAANEWGGERERERGGRREGHHCRLSVVTGLCCKRLCMPVCVCDWVWVRLAGGFCNCLTVVMWLAARWWHSVSLPGLPVCLFPYATDCSSDYLSLFFSLTPLFPSLFLPLCPVLLVIFHMQFLEIFRIRNICRHGKETCRLQQHQA